MRKQKLYIIIAVAVVIAMLLYFSRREKYSTVSYTAGADSTPTPEPVQTPLSCVPADGVWSNPNPGASRSMKLASPCCQPPDYAILDPSYKTCANYALESDTQIQQCLANCCKNATAEKDSYDPSWYPMAQCGCALWCYNSKVPHFAKHGTAVHYIEGDIAEVNTPDTPAASGSNWRGWIDF